MKKITLALVFIVGSLFGYLPLNAAEIIRYVKEGGEGNGSSWENASGDLQEMIDEVFANADKGEVRVAAGIYYGGFLMKDGVNVYGGYPSEGGDERNLKENKTYLDGYHETRVVWQDESEYFENTTTWDGFYLQNGWEAGAGALISYRGVLSNCVIRNNSADGKTWSLGGGVLLKPSTAEGAPAMSGSLYNCVIINNQCEGEGGAIHVANSAACDIINCVIANNYSASNCGGVFLGDWNGWSRIQNNIIFGNEGADGISQLYQKQGPLLAVFNNLIEIDDITNVHGYNPEGREGYPVGYIEDNLVGEGIDPMFVKPTSFAGTALLDEDWPEIEDSDWSLQQESPCIDAGTDKDIPIRINGANPNVQAYSSVLKTDIIGEERIQGEAPDMGAYEFFDNGQSVDKIVNNETIDVIAAEGKITVQNLESGAKVNVYNISGVLVSNRTALSDNLVIEGLAAGIYIVKVDNKAVKIIL